MTDAPPDPPYPADCPSRTIIDTFANKWVLLVLGVLRLHGRPLRYNELRRRMDGVTQKVLTRTLRGLERDGLVRRAVYPTVPPKVEYSLTDLGLTAAHLATAIADWSTHHVPQILAARTEFDRATASQSDPVSATTSDPPG
jgi:DNA-binding HxlR family transcriptional regulator